MFRYIIKFIYVEKLKWYTIGTDGVIGNNESDVTDERVRLDARVLDANMLSSHRHGEGVAHKQDGLVTGRLGESAVHKYFVEKLGCSSVKWMNEDNESGLPYDISITKADATEYVEVKATSIPNKNWFHITRRELQFAAENGDSLTIAYVLLRSQIKQALCFWKTRTSLHDRGIWNQQALCFSKADTSFYDKGIWSLPL